MHARDFDFLSLVPSVDLLDEEHDQRVAEFEAQQDAHHEAARDDELRRHLVACGCPVKDLARVLDGTCEDTEALASLRTHGEPRDGLFVLSGVPGCGKTTAAAWWLVQRRSRVPYVATSAPRFITADELSRFPKYDEQRMRKLTRCRALVIDDLGEEFSDTKGAFVSTLGGIVNNRYSAELPTLITTNLPAKAFKDRYGERLADRIRETGQFISLASKSMRGRNNG